MQVPGGGEARGVCPRLITVPWLLSVYAGRVDIEDGVAKYRAGLCRWRCRIGRIREGNTWR